MTIVNWEKGRTRPIKQYFERLEKILGDFLSSNSFLACAFIGQYMDTISPPFGSYVQWQDLPRDRSRRGADVFFGKFKLKATLEMGGYLGGPRMVWNAGGHQNNPG